LETTAAISAKLSLRDIKPGDEIQTLTGETGIYMGGLFPVTSTSVNVDDHRKTMITIETSKRYVVKYVIDGVVTYWGKTSLQIGSIITPAKEKLTPSQIDLEIAQAVKLEISCCKLDTLKYGVECRGWLTNPKGLELSSSMVETTEDEIKKLSKAFHSWSTTKLTTLASGGGKLLNIEYLDNFGNSRVRANRNYPSNLNSSATYYGYHNITYVKCTGFVGCLVDNFTSGSPLTMSSQYITEILEVDLEHLYIVEFDILMANVVKLTVFL
jgi:hypothetical protein